MNAKISLFVIFVETIIYLLLYNIHDYTFSELIAFSSCAMPRARVSFITSLQLRVNRYKTENDKQKCLLIIFF